MAKPQHAFVCMNCGALSPRWAGKCAECGAWNSMAEEAQEPSGVGFAIPSAQRGKTIKLEALSAETKEPPRRPSGIAELDRVLGGGIVPGSAILIGGDPGIGKSTIVLQMAARVAEGGGRVLYVSGEEAAAQVRLRAERLGLRQAPVSLGAETSLANILATAQTTPKPELIIVDSIQTLWSEAVESAPGTVAQVRWSAQALVRLAKTTGICIVLVGHVTKEGQIAGPKVVEHMVDTVLYFEGDRGHQYRILRAVKNRFGPSDEIGVFEMRGDGLREVANPSSLFLGDRDHAHSGTAVFAGMEGTRPLLIEIQALVAASPLGTPRRAVVGWDPNRLSMLLAVLDARCGVRLSTHDVYLNVAGGLRINEPAADLAAAAALLSALADVPLPPNAVYFGEVSLTGAVRVVSHAALRLKEAQKLGFDSATIPAGLDKESDALGLRLTPLSQLSELAGMLLGADHD